MTGFIQAVADWNKSRDEFIKKNSEPGRDKAPRKNIFITVPLAFEEDIKAYVKAKRKEADSKHTGTSDLHRAELGIQFEESNPPPRRSDYE